MCFTLGWLQTLLVNIVIIIAMVMLIRLLLPWLFGMLGIDGGVILQAINIIVWAIVVIFCIYIAFALIGCLGGLGHLSLMPPSR